MRLPILVRSILAGCGIFLGLAWAETANFKFAPIRLPAAPVFTVLLPESAASWQLGVTAPSHTQGLPTAYVTGKEPSCFSCPPQQRLLTRFRALDWKLTGGTIDLSPAANAQAELLILLALPAGAGIEVKQGGRLVLQASANDKAALYETGVLSTKSFTTVPSFFMTAARPDFTPGPEARMGAKGVLLVSPAYLKRHLAAMNLPSFPAPTTTEGAGILLQIDSTGAVTSAEIAGEASPFSTAMRAEMLRWRFRPILHEGEAVAAKAMLTVLLRPSGAIDIPGF